MKSSNGFLLAAFNQESSGTVTGKGEERASSEVQLGLGVPILIFLRKKCNYGMIKPCTVLCCGGFSLEIGDTPVFLNKLSANFVSELKIITSVSNLDF